MRYLRSAATAVSAAVAVGSLAACGDRTRTLAVPTLVARANATCAAYATRVEALTAPAFDPGSATAAQLGAAGRYLDRAVPLLQSEQASIEAIGTPRTDRSLYASVLTALAAHVRDEAAARDAAHARNLHAFRAAVATDKQDSTRLAGVAQQFGLNRCV